MMYTAIFYGETLAERTAPPLPDDETPRPTLSDPETVLLNTLLPSCESLSEFTGTATVQSGSALVCLWSHDPIPPNLCRDILNLPGVAYRLQKRAGDDLRFELCSAPTLTSRPSAPPLAPSRSPHLSYAAAAAATAVAASPTRSPTATRGLRVVEVDLIALRRIFCGTTLDTTAGKRICTTLRRAMALLYPNVFVRVVSRAVPFTTAHVQDRHRDFDISLLRASTDFQTSPNETSFAPTAGRTLVVLICKPADHDTLVSAARTVREWLSRPRLCDIVVNAGECSGASYKELTTSAGVDRVKHSLQPIFVVDCRQWDETHRQYECWAPSCVADVVRVVAPLSRTRVKVLVFLNATPSTAVTAVRSLCTQRLIFESVAFWHDDSPSLAVVDAAVDSGNTAFASYVLERVIFLDACAIMDAHWRKSLRKRVASLFSNNTGDLEYLLNVCGANHSRYLSCMHNLYPIRDGSDDESDSE